ncbi:MAG: MBL fold metallo-hydrolase [Anaerolineae bacterium]
MVRVVEYVGAQEASFMGLNALDYAPDNAPDNRPDLADRPYAVVLGIAQDAGYPQAGCRATCCARAWAEPAARRRAACLGLVDPVSGGRWLIDATPDFKVQLRALDSTTAPRDGTRPPDLSGIALTHAHIGHYTGLLHLGREAIGAAAVRVYAMPLMCRFLGDNAPWSQLVADGNVELVALEAGAEMILARVAEDEAPHVTSKLPVRPSADQTAPRVTLTPLLVPHRDELSETVAYRIDGPRRSILYLPDIDGWSEWDQPLAEMIRDVDVAYLDGTFYCADELPGHRALDVPHPTVRSTMDLLAGESPDVRSRVRFLHLNHTNPALRPDSPEARDIAARGFSVAEEGERIRL